MLRTFPDCSKVRLEYFPYLTAAFNKGIFKGSDGMINPKAGLTRAEAFTFLYRIMQSTGRIKAAYTPLTGQSAVTLEQAKRWARAKGAADIFINILFKNIVFINIISFSLKKQSDDCTLYHVQA